MPNEDDDRFFLMMIFKLWFLGTDDDRNVFSLKLCRRVCVLGCVGKERDNEKE